MLITLFNNIFSKLVALAMLYILQLFNESVIRYLAVVNFKNRGTLA